jgi:hypothetical protein
VRSLIFFAARMIVIQIVKITHHPHQFVALDFADTSNSVTLTYK